MLEELDKGSYTFLPGILIVRPLNIDEMHLARKPLIHLRIGASIIEEMRNVLYNIK